MSKLLADSPGLLYSLPSSPCLLRNLDCLNTTLNSTRGGDEARTVLRLYRGGDAPEFFAFEEWRLSAMVKNPI
jgi:hypothetical protein